MQRWCQWQIEPLFRFVMGVCLVLGASGIGTMFILKFVGNEGGASDFPAVILHTLVFHGGVMALVALFLKEQGLTWVEGFGVRIDQLKPLLWPVILTTIACLVSAQLLGRLAGYVIEILTGEAPKVQGTVEMLRESHSLARLAYMGLVTIVLAPVAEEILFRGILFTSVLQFKGRWVAVVSNSLLFGLIHSNLLTLVPLIVMAVMLTLLYERTRNLLAPIVAHSLFNLANFLMLMLDRSE
ncbi:MAG: CPBP family intramembrane metalloprotease [Verrucomicrobia bacterium]|nr:CPBP family intramembrane metalloprotease [Verrucomicrobiota bacterium]